MLFLARIWMRVFESASFCGMLELLIAVDDRTAIVYLAQVAGKT
jgi:hypothetical protein